MSAQDIPEAELIEQAGWGTVRRFLPYLWPKNRPDLRWRIVVAALLVLDRKSTRLNSSH